MKAAFNEWAKNGESITIIFVTSDQSDDKMKDYFKEHGDYLALPFGSDKIQGLKGKFNVQGIPKLVIVDKDMKVKDEGARSTVANKKDQAIKEWQK